MKTELGRELRSGRTCQTFEVVLDLSWFLVLLVDFQSSRDVEGWGGWTSVGCVDSMKGFGWRQ